jgi:hypothetical protein
LLIHLVDNIMVALVPHDDRYDGRLHKPWGICELLDCHVL